MMPRSLLVPLLVVLSISFTAHAARRSTEGVKESPRQAAVTSYQQIIHDGQALIAECGSKLANTKDESTKSCLTTLEGNLKHFHEPLSKQAPEQSDAKFGEARDALKEMLSIPTDTGMACADETIKTEPVVKKVYHYEDLLQTTLDLMEAARPSPAPPPEEPEDDSTEGEESPAAA